VTWADASLDLGATFAPLLSLPFAREVVNTPNGQVEGGPVGVLDGLQVASKLAKDDNVLATLRRALDAEGGRLKSPPEP
jgi:hypothetical protein